LAHWEDILAVLIIGGAIIKNKKQEKKNREEREYRRSFVCYFDDGITEEEFETIVRKSTKK